MARNILEDGTYTTSQYTKNLAQWKSDDEEYTYWESQFLNPLKSTYEATEQTAKTTAGYDITGAYKNYLNYQTQLSQSNLLGTSQSKLGEQSKLGYQSAYSSALSDYYKTTAKAYDEYQTGLASAQEEISAIGEKLKSFDELTNEFIAANHGSYGYSQEDIKNMYSKNKLGEDVLTDLGRNVYANILENVDEKTGRNVFYDYLKEQDEDLYEFALQNPDMLREVLFGYSSDEAEELSTYKLSSDVLADKYNIKDDSIRYDVTFSNTDDLDAGRISINGSEYALSLNPNRALKAKLPTINRYNVIEDSKYYDWAKQSNLKTNSIVEINDKLYYYSDLQEKNNFKFYELTRSN